jgi:alkanesulfonate monooxygenase SsuD/methylene tetrahydromethanopterin reductase-like flavin-dependent oxidoreductase (luciferase family)
VTVPTFGIFDHIEGIPGTPTPKLFKDRLDLVRMADQAGFAGYHIAEHHGSDLCMAPAQEMFVAAASQITDNIRMGPMVKILPLHHPIRIIEDLCVADNLTNGRIEFGVGRGVAPIEHYWFGGDWPNSTDRFEDILGIICRAFRTGEISTEDSKYYDFRTMPMSTMPVQKHIPFWYPGSPVTAGKFGLNLMWPGPIDQETYDLYAQTWYDHANDDVRMNAPDAKPRVGCAMLMAIDEDESKALDVSARGMNGLMRRTHGVHQWDAEVLGEEGAYAALGPLRRILGHIDIAIKAGAGTPSQLRDRIGGILAQGLTDYIVLQIPTGDMTFEEAKKTMDLFCSEVKPDLEKAAAA